MRPRCTDLVVGAVWASRLEAAHTADQVVVWPRTNPVQVAHLLGTCRSPMSKYNYRACRSSEFKRTNLRDASPLVAIRNSPLRQRCWHTCVRAGGHMVGKRLLPTRVGLDGLRRVELPVQSRRPTKGKQRECTVRYACAGDVVSESQAMSIAVIVSVKTTGLIPGFIRGA